MDRPLHRRIHLNRLSQKVGPPLIAATVERGQHNLAMLEGTVIKDNTLFPGEWYGGQLHLQPPASNDGGKVYSIILTIGFDRHEIEVVHDKAS